MSSGDTTTSTPMLTPSMAGGDTSTTPSADGSGVGGPGLRLSEEDLKRLTEAVVGVIRSSGAVPGPVPSAAEGGQVYRKTYSMHAHVSCICTHGMVQNFSGRGSWSGTPAA